MKYKQIFVRAKFLILLDSEVKLRIPTFKGLQYFCMSKEKTIGVSKGIGKILLYLSALKKLLHVYFIFGISFIAQEIA